MSQKHTPGPFEVQDPMGDDEGLWIVQAGLEAYEWSCIAIVPRDEDRSGKHFITKREQYANAALFAAAPELLEALKGFNMKPEMIVGATAETIVLAIPTAVISAAAEAIAKAEGRSTLQANRGEGND